MNYKGKVAKGQGKAVQGRKVHLVLRAGAALCIKCPKRTDVVVHQLHQDGLAVLEEWDENLGAGEPAFDRDSIDTAVRRAASASTTVLEAMNRGGSVQ